MRASFFVVIVVLLAGCSPSNTSQPSSAAGDAKGTGASAVAGSASGPARVTGKAPRGAVVVLEPTTARPFPPPEGPVIMDQYGRAFVPQLLVARVGQPVEFRNSEDVQHNVRLERSPTGTMVLNETGEPFETFTHRFDQPGDYDVTCDIHPGMRAAIHVTASPYAVVADESGNFTFNDVAAGPYKLVIMTPDRKRSERAVEVTAGRALNVS